MMLSYLFPLTILLLLYGPALRGWFQQDDFAWLYMSRWMPEGSGWVYKLFSPQAQGTIRPLGDRLFYASLFSVFGRNAVVFHLIVLATQCAAVLLWVNVAARLTGRYWTGGLAAVLWITHSALVGPLVWISAYNQVLWAFLLLLAFFFKLKHLETGERRFLVLEWIAFILGFGAVELNVVYPMLAGVLVWFAGEKQWKSVAMQAGVAVLYTAVHMWAAPMAHTGPYVTAVDGRIWATFAEYWKLSLGAGEFGRTYPAFSTAAVALPVLLTLAAVIALVFAIRRREKAVWFGAAWYLIALAPVLILPDHVSDYYLFVPVMGLALMGAASLQMLQKQWTRMIAIGVLALYSAMNLAAAIVLRDATVARTIKVRHIYDTLAEIRSKGARGCVLLSGMNDDEFWGGYYGIRRYVPDLQDVYLAPGAERSLTPFLDIFGRVVDYTMAPPEARARLADGTCVVFDISRRNPVNVTAEFLAKLP